MGEPCLREWRICATVIRPPVERQISFHAIRRRGDNGRDFANPDTLGRLTCEPESRDVETNIHQQSQPREQQATIFECTLHRILRAGRAIQLRSNDGDAH